MEIVLVFGILVLAVVLFATEKFPIDLVAVMVLGALLVLRLVTPEEGVSGFSNPATITVGSMFVLSAGLQKTGALNALGRALIRLGRFPSLLLVMVMVVTGLASAFINNTATVAVFLPLVLAVCSRRKLSPSKFLIPMSFASEFGGVCTLIGTSTNLLVSSIAVRSGLPPFSMFELGRLGLILCGVGIVYLLLIGRWMLPSRRGEQLTEAYHLGEYITELRVLEGSPLIGKTILESKFGQVHDATVLEILRDQQKIWSPLSEPLRVADVLLVRGKIQDLMEMKTTKKLEIEPEFKLKDEALEVGDVQLVEALVSPGSHLIGRTLAEMNFRSPDLPISLSGSASSEDNILNFKNSLEEDPQFSNIVLPLTGIQSAGGIVRFSMTFSLVR